MSAAIGLMIGSGILNAMNAQDQSDAQRRIIESNQKFLELKARDVEENAKLSSARWQEKVTAAKGQLEASFAAQNVDISSGAALALSLETSRYGQEDSMQIINNAWREAWGIKQKIGEMELQKDMARIAGQHAAITGLFGAAASAMSMASTNSTNAKLLGMEKAAASSGSKSPTIGNFKYSNPDFIIGGSDWLTK